MTMNHLWRTKEILRLFILNFWIKGDKTIQTNWEIPKNDENDPIDCFVENKELSKQNKLLKQQIVDLKKTNVSYPIN